MPRPFADRPVYTVAVALIDPVTNEAEYALKPIMMTSHPDGAVVIMNGKRVKLEVFEGPYGTGDKLGFNAFGSIQN